MSARCAAGKLEQRLRKKPGDSDGEGREGGTQVASHESVRTLPLLLRDRKPSKGSEQRSCNGLPQSVVLWSV